SEWESREACRKSACLSLPQSPKGRAYEWPPLSSLENPALRANPERRRLLRVLGLRELADHEADVGITRERRRLEHALDHQSGHVGADGEEAAAGDRLALPARRRPPQLALGLQDVEELVDALHAARVLDGSCRSRGRAVDEDLAAVDRDHRRVDHVD